MTRRDDSVYLRHMLDYARDATAIIQGRSREDLEADRTFRYALLHVACITGEAAARVSTEGRKKHLNIPWKPLVEMRNRFIGAARQFPMRLGEAANGHNGVNT